MTIDEQIEVMQHFRDGGEVEYRSRLGSHAEWKRTIKPEWNFPLSQYRKKPAPKTRFMTAEELKGKWLRGWNDDGYLYQVTSIDPHAVFLSGWSNRLEDCWINIQDLVSDEFKLEDGSPLNVEVEG